MISEVYGDLKKPIRKHFKCRNDCCDQHQWCRFWASARECATNRVWMIEHCQLSCKVCPKRMNPFTFQIMTTWQAYLCMCVCGVCGCPCMWMHVCMRLFSSFCVTLVILEDSLRDAWDFSSIMKYSTFMFFHDDP